MAKTRYDVAESVEAQSESGSRGRVLRNLAGITSARVMDLAEAWCLKDLMTEVGSERTWNRRLTEQDVCELHRRWLGTIYPWAGNYRSVNISKPGVSFAMARFIPQLMHEFDRSVLARLTPCRGKGTGELAAALAEVHVELILIHPFREGNGRLARLLSGLMATQAGRCWPKNRSIEGRNRERYFAAIKAGRDRNYDPMAGLFRKILAEPA